MKLVWSCCIKTHCSQCIKIKLSTDFMLLTFMKLTKSLNQICFINSAESFNCHLLVFHCIELNRYGIILNRYDFKIFDVEFVARFK